MLAHVTAQGAPLPAQGTQIGPSVQAVTGCNTVTAQVATRGAPAFNPWNTSTAADTPQATMTTAFQDLSGLNYIYITA